MNLYRIQNLLYNKPWLITPSVHQSLVKQFESHMEGKKAFDMPMPEDEDEDDMLEEAVLEMVSKVAIIKIDGIIGKHLSMMETMCGGVDCDAISQELQSATDDPEIETVVLYINSPGGTVTGVRELGELIAKCKDKKSIVGYTDTMAASAAYWLASQCTSFYCAASADVGSIGVYCLLLDESVALANEGLKVNAISAGKYKLMGASFKPLTDEERAMFQADVDKTYAQFKEAITSSRDIEDEDMQGQVFDGETAVMKNLADGNVSSLDELLQLIGQTKQL